MATLEEITTYCDGFLQSENFKDYCPNGLQVEGEQDVNQLVTAVTASKAAIEAAIDLNADMLLVHHGFFWKNEKAVLTGMKGDRIKALMQNEISLVAYHLPLDVHPQVGNNAQLARRLKWADAQAISEDGLLWQVKLEAPLSACGLSQLLSGALDREPMHIAGGPMQFNTIGWCTGAAQSYIDQAVDAGCQAFISGEISESTTHAARELGVHYFSAGHHATERYGVQALGQHLAEKFAVSHQFVEISNPV